MAASPLPSLGSKREGNCYATPAFLGVPNKGGEIRIGYPTPAFSGAHKLAKVLRDPCIIGAGQERGKIRSGCPTPTSSGAKTRAEFLRNPYTLGGPNKGDKVTIGYPTPIFTGDKKEGGSATSPMHYRGFRAKGTRSEVAASPLSSPGPKRGRNGYVTPTFSGVPNKGEKIRSGCLTPAFSGAQKRAELRHDPCILGGSQQRGNN